MTGLPPGSRFLHRVSFVRMGRGCDTWLDGKPMGTMVLDPDGTHDRYQAPNGETHCVPVEP